MKSRKAESAEEKTAVKNPYAYDYGPLRTYEVTWADGRTETVQGHSVVFDSKPGVFDDDDPGSKRRFAIRGEFDGHWRFVIGGFADDVKQVRDITPAAGQAVLPASLCTPVVGTMKPGETGYTVPWAMLADKQERLWLKPDYPVTQAPHGTSQLRVERRKNDFTVRVPSGQTYQPEHPWQKDLLPVGRVEEGDSSA